jgi:hypothetical protein
LPPSSEFGPNFLSTFFFLASFCDCITIYPPWRGHRAVEHGVPICSEGIDQYDLSLPWTLLKTCSHVIAARQECLVLAGPYHNQKLMFVLCDRKYYTSEAHIHQLVTLEKTNFVPQLGCANLWRTTGAS